MAGEMSGGQKIGGVYIDVGVKGAEQAQASLKDVGATAQKMGADVGASASAAAGAEGGTTGMHGLGSAAKAVRAAFSKIILPAFVASQITRLITWVEEARSAVVNLGTDAIKSATEIQTAFAKIKRPSLGSDEKDAQRDLVEKMSAARQQIEDEKNKALGDIAKRSPFQKAQAALGLLPSKQDIEANAKIQQAAVEAGGRAAAKNINEYARRLEREAADEEREERIRKSHAESLDFQKQMVEWAQKLSKENDKMVQDANAYADAMERAREAFLNSTNQSNLSGGSNPPAVLTEIRNELRRINLNTRN